jgi:two-component system nitrate/nitrite sensor histidine kinase NarX
VPLADLLRQLADSLTGRARLPIELTVQLNDPLPPEIKVAFYRIAQEALNNVVKHAAATHIVVQLTDQPTTPSLPTSRETDRIVALTIRDNGVGFSPQAITADHMGLGIMHERATAAGITLNIESWIGRGTVVKASWPVEGRAEDVY